MGRLIYVREASNSSLATSNTANTDHRIVRWSLASVLAVLDVAAWVAHPVAASEAHLALQAVVASVEGTAEDPAWAAARRSSCPTYVAIFTVQPVRGLTILTASL
jgi:hypothetical protein